MPQAELNPSTLKIIRTQAYSRSVPDIAKDLGWTVERVRRVAWERCGFELPKPTDLKSVVESPAPKPQPEKSGDPELVLQSIILALPRQRRAVLDLLAQSYRNDAADFVSSTAILQALGLNSARQNVPHAINKIRRALDGSPWSVESLVARDGGFRLALKSNPMPAPSPVVDNPRRRCTVDLFPDSTIEQIVATLPGRQSDIFRILSDHMDSGDLIGGRDLIMRMGTRMNRGSISQMVRKTADNLLGTKYRIETKAGGLGERGYRVVKLP